MTNYNGLTTKQVIELQKKYGKNELRIVRKNSLLKMMFHAICEPIFLLLIASTMIYFFLGEESEGLIMLAFVMGIIVLDVSQEWKTDKTLEALKKFSQPLIRVIRDGVEVKIASIDLVPGDIILLEEGCKIPADGYVLAAHDFCLDESILTGEAGEVWKTPTELYLPEDEYIQEIIEERTAELEIAATDFTRDDYCFAGTLVTQGIAAILVNKIGLDTVYGKIGLGITNAPRRLTPLQQQMKSLTKCSTWIAFLLFVSVTIITYFNLPFSQGSIEITLQYRIIQSLLAGVVLSLSMIPAEFPVILTVFLSMGALRLIRKHALIRKLPSVETLGAVSVICVDKTGTITKNEMTVKNVWMNHCDEAYLAKIAGMACDRTPYDSMEQAILTYCSTLGYEPDQLFDATLLKGYPFTQQCKTMAHVWNREGNILITAKGSPEWLLDHCVLTPSDLCKAKNEALRLSQRGLRVIAVVTMELQNEDEIPELLQECQFNLCGLIGLLDPPKESIEEDIRICMEAGIRVVMITGDNGNTAAAIAEQIHLPFNRMIMTGSQIDVLSDMELQKVVRKVSIFSRVVPEQKLRIIKAFQENGTVVAMTGDGVNDAPALKHADIGIAMGLKGSEVTREAADMVLLDDNFSTIVDTIKDGRRIYDNIQKAIGYVFTIHIPIALACLTGPLLHIIPERLMLLPLHVVLLELVMNPTCTTVLERQPADTKIMKHGPRVQESKLFSIQSLLKSVIQGLTIYIGSFGSYYYFLLQDSENVPLARTIGLSVLILANIFLIIVNSSNTESAYRTIKILIQDKGITTVGLATILLLVLTIYSPLSKLLLLTPLNARQIVLTILIAFVSVFWFEMVKLFKKYS